MWHKYYRTCLLRVWQETWRWGKEQVLIVLLAIATLALQLQEGLAQHATWRPSLIAIIAPYVAYAVIFLLYEFFRVPAMLYVERDTLASNTEQALKGEIAAGEQKINLLTPKRTPVEQQDYEVVRKSVALLRTKDKETGRIALQHLRRVGIMRVNAMGATGGSALPPGLSLQETLWVYDQCHSEGIVHRESNVGMGEHRFSISPAMAKAVAEVLCEDDSTSAG